MFLFRRLIGRLLFTVVLGFVIRKLMASDNLRVSKIGHTANRALGNAFGVDATRKRGRPRRAAGTASSAAVGGLMSYFFDPVQGSERRARVKAFASERMGRMGGARPALPAAVIPAGAGTVTPPAVTRRVG